MKNNQHNQEEGQQPKQPRWEIEFENLMLYEDGLDSPWCMPDDVKAFIRTEISKAKQEGYDEGYMNGAMERI